MSQTANVESETKNVVSTEEDTKHSGSGSGDEQTEPKKQGDQASKKKGEQASKKNGEQSKKANGEQAKKKNEGSNVEGGKSVTKIPVMGGDTDFKKEGSQSSQNTREESHSIPVTIHDESSVPVTIHHEEEKKQQKQLRQPSKKEKAESLKQQANKEFAAKRYAAAIQIYNEALSLDPLNHLLYSNRAAARYNLAQEIANQAEHPDAKDHCALHSESSPSWNASMSLYYGGLEDALKAIEIEPNFLKAYLRVGACLSALGKYQAAVQTYEATLTRFPTEESVKTALKEAREKAAKIEEGFPLFHSFINLAGQPRSTKPSAPQSAPPSDDAASETAARLHRELFGKRNALVQTPKPETRWQFYFEQPPNPRSTAAWEPDPRRRDAGEDEEYQGEEEEQQYQQPRAHFQRQSQYQPHPPRFQRSPFQSPFQQQSQPQPHFQQQHQFHQPQPSYQSQQPSYQQPYPQSPHFQQQPPSQPQYQPNRKRSDHTSIPNRKATNGYLQELCEKLRVSQYLPALLEQGVETVDDLMLLPPEAIQSIFPTLGHQARVLDWLKKARGEL